MIFLMLFMIVSIFSALVFGDSASTGAVANAVSVPVDWNAILGDTLTQVIRIVTIAVATQVAFLIKHAISQIKIGIIRQMALRLVKSAYQKFADDQKAEKFKYVSTKLSEKFPAIKPNDIDDIIEEAVKTVKMGLE